MTKEIEQPKKQMGRPRKELKWDVLDGILQFGARLIDCSELCGLSEDVVQNRIKESFGCTFSEYRERKMSSMRMKLLQKQYDVAMMGNVSMLIWLGKQHLEQKDKHETDIKTTMQIVIDEADKGL